MCAALTSVYGRRVYGGSGIDGGSLFPRTSILHPFAHLVPGAESPHRLTGQFFFDSSHLEAPAIRPSIQTGMHIATSNLFGSGFFVTSFADFVRYLATRAGRLGDVRQHYVAPLAQLVSNHCSFSNISYAMFRYLRWVLWWMLLKGGPALTDARKRVFALDGRKEDEGEKEERRNLFTLYALQGQWGRGHAHRNSYFRNKRRADKA